MPTTPEKSEKTHPKDNVETERDVIVKKLLERYEQQQKEKLEKLKVRKNK